MTTRRLFFGFFLILILGMAYWGTHRAAELRRVRELVTAVRAVPGRIQEFNVPMSKYFDANWGSLPNTRYGVVQYGFPSRAFGEQADGTVIEISNMGTIDVRLRMPGTDQKPGHLLFFPVLDPTVRPPEPWVQGWNCVTDNLPDVTQWLPACKLVDDAGRNAQFAAQVARIERMVSMASPAGGQGGVLNAPAPVGTLGSPGSEGTPAPAAPPPPGSVAGTTAGTGPVSLTPAEVEAALRSGKSLEAALAEKRRMAGQAAPASGLPSAAGAR